MLHYVVCCSFYLYPELMTDLIAFHNMYLYMMVAFSTGKMSVCCSHQILTWSFLRYQKPTVHTET